MNQKPEKPGAIGRLEEVLAACGASPARWPKGDRARLEAMCALDPAAKRLLAEAVALDRLLDKAPAGKASAALQRRIIVAAAAEAGARIVPLDAARSRRTVSARPYARGGFWPAAALAASFAFGLYLGTTALGTGVVEAAMGTDTSVSDRSDALAWLSDTTSAGDVELPL